ncbi:hypothetical protein SteCoe_31108 [Stentor coeruleus]|uniref:Uncharacterized protein n=1 Tax=Stentor coeruleus TaxID=5963 RepID=A0A1R2B227_9CILI|nr:hypothetical protein SteCoe_31108 [Stentor coeruleus]
MEEKNNIEDLLQGQTHEAKLKSAIEIIESLEKEIFKLRTEFKKSEASFKKFQESTSACTQNQHNTSSAFSLPSEFKKSWEILIQETILDLFSPFLDSYKDLAIFAQELIKLILNEVSICIDEKVIQVMKILGCGHEKMENIKKYLLRMFQDHYLTAFPTVSIDGIKEKYIQRLPVLLKNEGKKICESSDFFTFVSSMHKLSLHMFLNDPKLEILFQNHLEIVKIEKPEDFCCIDGFPNNQPEAVVIVPSVMRHNYPYAGIKPSVLILNEDMKKNPTKFIEKSQESIKVLENNVETDNETKIVKEEKTENNEKKSPRVKKLSSNQVIDLYCRYKRNLSRNKYEDGLDAYPPLQQKTKEQISRCKNCKEDISHISCSKENLIALAKKSSIATNSYRNLTPNKPCLLLNCSNKKDNGLVVNGKDKSFSEDVGKGQNRNVSSLLNKRLSEAARKMDRKAFIKNKHLDKESCKVM